MFDPSLPNIQNPNTVPLEVERKAAKKRIAIKIASFVVLASLFIWLGSMDNDIGVSNPIANFWQNVTGPAATPDPDYVMPVKEKDRVDVLVLSVRGEDEVDSADAGPLLTDSIQIFSYSKTSSAASIVSLPRDLYVMTANDKKEKLNAVYEYGYYHSNNSLQFIKNRISQITGVYIDYVIVFDFASFKEIVDTLGGVDITLAKPFTETQQWGYSFSLPAGPNHLDGQTALYYARSRYSSSDFDRSQRQQQIMFAIKDKLVQLDFTSDPVKAFSILNLVRKDVKTDIGLVDAKLFIDISHAVDLAKIKRSVISTDNLLYESRVDNSYVLLPKGDNFNQIKAFFQTVLGVKAS